MRDKVGVWLVNMQGEEDSHYFVRDFETGELFESISTDEKEKIEYEDIGIAERPLHFSTIGFIVVEIA